MKKARFDELFESVVQAGNIHLGEARPSREHVLRAADVRAIPARALLVVAAQAPKVVEKALTKSTRRG